MEWFPRDHTHMEVFYLRKYALLDLLHSNNFSLANASCLTDRAELHFGAGSVPASTQYSGRLRFKITKVPQVKERV